MKTKKRLKTPSEKKTENNFKKLIGSIALVNIYSTLNNVIVSVTDSVGNVIFSQSAGMITKGSRKSTLNSVNSVTNIVTETMQKYNISDIKIKIKGIGLGDFVLKKIYSLGWFKVHSLMDLTVPPFNGPRRKKKPKGKFWNL